MAEDPRQRLGEAAHLDARARALLDDLDAAAAEALVTAWDEAVTRQDAEIDTAIEGSLSLLPGIVRRRVLKILTRGRR